MDPMTVSEFSYIRHMNRASGDGQLPEPRPRDPNRIRVRQWPWVVVFFAAYGLLWMLTWPLRRIAPWVLRHSAGMAPNLDQGLGVRRAAPLAIVVWIGFTLIMPIPGAIVAAIVIAVFVYNNVNLPSFGRAN